MIKRILATMLAIILVFAFASCKDEEVPYWESVDYAWISGGEGWIIDMNGYEYAYFMTIYKDHYMDYKQIAFLGHLTSWADFGQYSAFGLDAYDDYMSKDDEYVTFVENANNFKIELFYKKTEHEVLPPEEESYFGMLPIDIACVDRSTGMRKLQNGYYGGFVDVDGVRYIYTHGTLQGIKWVHTGYDFILYVPEIYPVQYTESFAAKMMDPALAPAARDAFNRAFDAYTEVTG